MVGCSIESEYPLGNPVGVATNDATKIGFVSGTNVFVCGWGSEDDVLDEALVIGFVFGCGWMVDSKLLYWDQLECVI